MTSVNEREEVKKVYPSESWASRVDNMSEAQITALYLKFKAQGKLR